ncbi:MAG: ABC transporter permease [bacterium]
MFICRVRQLSYLLRQGVQGIKSAGISAGVAVVSIACSLLLLCLYFMAFSNLSKALDSAKNIQVVLYLRDNLKQPQISLLQQSLAGCDGITGIRFVSKAAALKEFRETLGEDASLLDGLDTNPLPASLELSLSPNLKEPDQFKPLLQHLASMPEVESVQGGVEWIEKLSNLLTTVRLVLFLLGTVLTAIALFITASTIHLTIDRKRDEIAVMRLVGASNWYIRFPFLIEGMLEGFIGGGLAIVTSAVLHYAFCWKVSPFLDMIFGASAVCFLEPEEMFFILLLGLFVGGLGAMVSFSYHSA